MPDALTVRPAHRSESPQMVGVLAQALPVGAFGEWLVPDPVARRAVFPSFMAIIVEDCFDHGEPQVIDGVDGPVAVALWYPHYDPSVGPKHYETHLQAACGPNTPRFEQLDEAFAEHHPVEDHDYLAFVAVQPGMQRQGLGSALLRAHLEQLDRTGRAAHLEASSEDNRRLYERLGFQAAPVRHLPDGPPYWTCWRPPSR